MHWLDYGDDQVARLRRSRNGLITPIRDTLGFYIVLLHLRIAAELDRRTVCIDAPPVSVQFFDSRPSRKT
jgi:hypothetical protein